MSGFYEGPVAAAMIAVVNGAGGVWRASDLMQYSSLSSVISALELPRGAIYIGRSALGRRDSAGTKFRHTRAVSIGEWGNRQPTIHRRSVKARLFTTARGISPIPISSMCRHTPALEALTARSRAAGIDVGHATEKRRAGCEDTARMESNTRRTSQSSTARQSRCRHADHQSVVRFGHRCPAQGCCLTTRWTISAVPPTTQCVSLRGGAANRIETRKRPLSSMTPTFVRRWERPARTGPRTEASVS